MFHQLETINDSIYLKASTRNCNDQNIFSLNYLDHCRDEFFFLLPFPKRIWTIRENIFIVWLNYVGHRSYDRVFSVDEIFRRSIKFQFLNSSHDTSLSECFIKADMEYLFTTWCSHASIFEPSKLDVNLLRICLGLTWHEATLENKIIIRRRHPLWPYSRNHLPNNRISS